MNKDSLYFSHKNQIKRSMISYFIELSSPYDNLKLTMNFYYFRVPLFVHNLSDMYTMVLFVKGWFYSFIWRRHSTLKLACSEKCTY